MKPLFAILLTLTLLVINSCSDQKAASDADKKDHVLRQQMDVMQDAKTATETLNQSINEQDAEAAAVAGH
jgi:hypothetical protein